MSTGDGGRLRVDLPGGKVVEYENDPLGRRIAKKINGVVVEKYLWQGMTQLLAVYDGSDNLLMRFMYTDSRMPVAMEESGVTYYLAYDQVCSLKTVADGSGNPAKVMEYDSFGNVISDSNPSFIVPFGFAGGLYDSDTGLVRFGYRDYDSSVGRWTAKDPILFDGGQEDLFGYVQNDPINWTDPWGLEATVTVDGNRVSINIPITYSGTGATPEVLKKFNEGIGKNWSGQFGKYDVTTTVTTGTDNKIEVPCGDGRATVTGTNEGNWPSERPEWTAAHEAGHLMGLPDQYTDQGGPISGYEGNIMGVRNGVPSGADIQAIIDRR